MLGREVGQYIEDILVLGVPSMLGLVGQLESPLHKMHS